MSDELSEPSDVLLLIQTGMVFSREAIARMTAQERAAYEGTQARLRLRRQVAHRPPPTHPVVEVAPTLISSDNPAGQLPGLNWPNARGVYAVRGGTRVKIGWGKCIAKRIADLQVACPHDLELLAWWEGERSLEKECHKSFRDSWVRGEWFELSCRMLVWIKARREEILPARQPEEKRGEVRIFDDPHSEEYMDAWLDAWRAGVPDDLMPKLRDSNRVKAFLVDLKRKNRG